jgi:hypothetical protein
MRELLVADLSRTSPEASQHTINELRPAQVNSEVQEDFYPAL